MGLLIITEADRRRLGIAGVQTRFEPEAGRKVSRRRLPFSDALCWRVESFFMHSTVPYVVGRLLHAHTHTANFHLSDPVRETLLLLELTAASRLHNPLLTM